MPLFLYKDLKKNSFRILTIVFKISFLSCLCLERILCNKLRITDHVEVKVCWHLIKKFIAVLLLLLQFHDMLPFKPSMFSLATIFFRVHLVFYLALLLALTLASSLNVAVIDHWFKNHVNALMVTYTHNIAEDLGPSNSVLILTVLCSRFKQSEKITLDI